MWFSLDFARLQGPPKNWEQGLVTLAKILVCAVSAVFVWSRGITFVPLPITKFLTCESSRLIPRPFENGSEASILFINLQFQKLGVKLRLLGYYSCLTRFAYSHSVARFVRLLSSTVPGYYVIK